MRTNIRRLLKNRKGASGTEYGLIAAGIAAAIIVAVNRLGGSLQLTFENIAGEIDKLFVRAPATS